MPTQVQFRRGTTAEHSTFTGAEGEITVDTTKDTAVVHDGSTAGGFPLLPESAIGTSVLAYDSNLATFVTAFTLPTTDGSSGEVLTTDGSGNLSFTSAGTGTVTSVDISLPTGLVVSGNPITGAGTLAVAYDTGYAIPTTASQGNWDTAYGWGDHAAAGYALSSSLATVATSGSYNDLIDQPSIPAAYTDADVDTHLNTATASNNEVLSWTGTDYDWVAQTVAYTNSDVDTHLNTGTASANEVLSWTGTDYDWVAQTAAYTNSDVDTHLNTATASSGEVLSWTGTDYDWITPSGGYTDADVDTHLNTATASNNEVLSWNGSDYDWVAQTAAYTDASVDTHLNTASANTNEVLSWTGSDYDWVAQTAAYTNSDVDSHLNTSTAGTGEVLSWNGTDYDWVAQSGGGGGALTIDNKTSAYTVVAGDLGKIINCTSGTFTVSLTAAATLGAGFYCYIRNYGSGNITIDPNGSEFIDDMFTTILRAGENVMVVCDGTSFTTLTGQYSQGGAFSRQPGAGRPVASATNSTALGSNSGGNASQAVTGSGAMALGGSRASGTDSFAAAVANNTSSYGAQGANSITMGLRAKATSQNSIVIGTEGSSTASYSTIIGGIGGSDNGIWGKFVLPAAFNAGGQQGLFILRETTANATTVVLRTNGAAAGTTNQVILPNNSAYAFSGLVVAREQAADGTDSAAWKVEGLIRREANAGTTTLVASTVTAIDNTPGWTLALSADTTNGGLKVEATGAAATDIRWVATIQTSEVTYA